MWFKNVVFSNQNKISLFQVTLRFFHFLHICNGGRYSHMKCLQNIFVSFCTDFQRFQSVKFIYIVRCLCQSTTVQCSFYFCWKSQQCFISQMSVLCNICQTLFCNFHNRLPGSAYPRTWWWIRYPNYFLTNQNATDFILI